MSIAERMCQSRFIRDGRHDIMATVEAANEEYEKLTSEEQRIVDDRIDEIL
jgi:hypothetical protein